MGATDLCWRDAVTLQLVPLAVPENRARFAIPIEGARLRLGRGKGNDVLLDDPQVSKQHAELVALEDGNYMLRDRQSSNGSFVNGAAIDEAVLQPGDAIRLGDCHFRYTDTDAQDAGAADQKPEVTIVADAPASRTQVLATASVEPKSGADTDAASSLAQEHERLRTAFQAVRDLMARTDIDALCEQILDGCLSLLAAETAAVLLYDDAGELQLRAFRSLRPDGHPVLSATVLDGVVQQRAAVLATDALADRRFSASESLVLAGARSVMCVPLLGRNTLYGVLHVTASEQAVFAEKDLDLVSGLGGGAGLALANAYLTHAWAQEARTRESLGRFFSPVLVEQVMQGTIDLQRGGHEETVTVLFADIREFTRLTEETAPADVVALLNAYFDQMVEVVFSNEGFLDKYVGDALMAVWGAPVAQRSAAKHAVAAALEMQETLTSFNAYRADCGYAPISVGVGLASGACVVGAIGARRRMEYTVIGDAVNLASRLSSLADAGQIICDERTYRDAGRPAHARRLEPTPVKGKAKPVGLYSLAG